MDSAVAKRPRITWGPVSAIIGSLLLFFGSQLVVGIIISSVLALMGWSDAQIETWFQDGGNVAVFIISLSVAAVELGALFVYLASKRAHPRDIGLVRPKVRDLGYLLQGTGLYVVAYIVIVGLAANLLPKLDTEQTQDLGFTATATNNELILIFISLVVLPPLIEEIIVRGFLFSGLRSKLSFWVAAVISSGLFGLAHLLGGENGSAIWIATIDTFILGMALAYLREKTGSLWAPIGLHALKNFVAFMALFVFKVT